jgi:2,4-dienoyl-CoA reductase-like NADH-dependent reductase (Old Yellow Enzyme family)/thioredoxin reductase
VEVARGKLAGMSNGTYERLFSPLAIGPVTSRNRIVFGAHFTQFTEPNTTWGEPGHYGPRLGRYLGARAQGGAGVVIAGQAQVHPTTAYQMPNNAVAWDDESVDGFRAVTAPIHDGGALAFLQLAHNGGVNRGDWSKLPVWAASDVPNYNEAPKAIERDEMREVVEHFARSAANAVAGGFDGIEVHGAHGYLIHEFLSPKSNHRTDEYGGSLENRMRFGVEVLEAVRAAVGSGVAVGLRLVGDEEQGAGGLTADDAAEIGARFEELGLVDFLNVSVGTSGVGMVRSMYAPHLLGVYASAAVKKRVSRTPVFAVHRILTPDEAEGILEREEADAVTVVRALIADESWAEKARTGRSDEIRKCTGNNQGCYGNLTNGMPITCVNNPVVGREDTLGAGTLTPASEPKGVVVVGGGPGGLEAAWVAAARGHSVTLLERAHELGGMIRLAQALPGREELADFADWRIAECERRGVDVRVGTEATADSVLALEPDAVVVATGGKPTKFGYSKWHPMPIPGAEQDFVLDHVAALRDPDAVGERVVILDAVGHIEAIGLGELLATMGREVTAVTTLPTPMLLDAETMMAALPRACRAGMRWRPNTAVAAIGDHEVQLVDALSIQFDSLPADTVVIRTHGVPEEGLYHELRDRVPQVLRVGDAIAVRLADRAIFDGHLAGRAI